MHSVAAQISLCDLKVKIHASWRNYFIPSAVPPLLAATSLMTTVFAPLLCVCVCVYSVCRALPFIVMYVCDLCVWTNHSTKQPPIIIAPELIAPPILPVSVLCLDLGYLNLFRSTCDKKPTAAHADTYKHKHARKRAHTHTCAHTHIHTHTHTHTRRTHTHTTHTHRSFFCLRLEAHSHKHMRTHMQQSPALRLEATHILFSSLSPPSTLITSKCTRDRLSVGIGSRAVNFVVFAEEVLLFIKHRNRFRGRMVFVHVSMLHFGSG